MQGLDTPLLGLPSRPIRRLTGPIGRFMQVQAASGIVLLLATLLALAVANSRWSASFLAFWETELGVTFGSFEISHSLKHWVNDGLMGIFFFVIGLEVKRELVIGELRDLRAAALPIFAAVGGMIVPAAIFLSLQAGAPGMRGWGIPMATDIAFVVGCMAILGSRVPAGLRVMLLSLAIADDIGAILVIAVGYSEALNWTALLCGFAGIAVVYGMARVGVRSILAYAGVGGLVWFAFHESGVHATIAGVILGLMTPTSEYVGANVLRRALDLADDVWQGQESAHGTARASTVARFRALARETVSPVEYLIAALNPWVGFLIMPVFALANAGVSVGISGLTDPVAHAAAAGLLLGKPVGIVLLSFLAVRLGLARLPHGVSWSVLAAGGVLAGIGFTMALFIAGLALDGELLSAAKVGVLGASAVAAVVGTSLLRWLLPGEDRGTSALEYPRASPQPPA
jgi:NhaA family Na+:H+ antiporter